MTWTITHRGYKTILDMGAPDSAEFIGPNHAANARLSASAPGLLSALENLLSLAELHIAERSKTPEEEDDFLSCPHILQARAEIAKVEGA